MGRSGSQIEPYRNTKGPSGQGATSSRFPKTAMRQRGRGSRRPPESARTVGCQQVLDRRRSHQNTSRTYPSRGDRDSTQTKRPSGGSRNILLQGKYISLRLAGLASSCALQDRARRSGNIANCNQRTFQALPKRDARARLERETIHVKTRQSRIPWRTQCSNPSRDRGTLWVRSVVFSALPANAPLRSRLWLGCNGIRSGEH